MYHVTLGTGSVHQYTHTHTHTHEQKVGYHYASACSVVYYTPCGEWVSTYVTEQFFVDGDILSRDMFE